MRRFIYILIGLAVFVPTAYLFSMRYRFMVGEGYPTWAAVRNYLVRDGEIVIHLPEGMKVVSAKCDDPSGDVQVDRQTVTTKIGYTWCTISIQTEVGGRSETLNFHPQKLNNWNRILFVPENPRDPRSTFLKSENGVIEAHSDVTRETSSEQDAPSNGG